MIDLNLESGLVIYICTEVEILSFHFPDLFWVL